MGSPRSWMLIIPNILDSIIPELIIKQQGFALLISLLCVGRSSKHRYAKLSDPGQNHKESQFVFCTEAKVGSVSQYPKPLNLNLRCPAIYILMCFFSRHESVLHVTNNPAFTTWPRPAEKSKRCRLKNRQYLYRLLKNSWISGPRYQYFIYRIYIYTHIHAHFPGISIQDLFKRMCFLSKSINSKKHLPSGNP